MITSKISKRLGFIVFCLVFVLTLCGAASAASTNSNHDNLNQSVNHTVNQLNTVTSNTNNISTSKNSTGTTKLPDPQVYNGHTYVGTYNTIADAIKAASSGDTIWLASGGTFDEHGLTINKNLDFNVFNKSQATINAQGKGQVFFIVGDVTVELENLILENGKATDGGAISNVGTLTVKDCTFTGNKATDDGGAISNDGVLNVTDSIFTGNKATDDAGGAIYNLPIGFSVIGSTFTNNTANYGGAIYNAGGSSNYPVKILSSTFTSDSAKQGGAIFNDYDSTLTVTSSTFKDNTGINSEFPSDGGAIDNRNNGILIIKTSTFTNNNANDGGAIGNCYGTLRITGSTFLNNKATSWGVIQAYGGAIGNSGNATLHFNRIVGNTATYGSAISNSIGKMDARFNWWGSNIKSNVAKQISNNYGGTVTYNPWIILTISASPTTVSVGGTSTITADFLHDSNGVYHNPSGGLVPYMGYANFKTTKGIINNVKYVNGKATSKLTNLTTSGVANISCVGQTPVTEVTVKT
jgi:predicted outer membrane repeat protein